MINCIVLFGGKSCEHDISVVTGLQVLNNLDEYIYNPIPVYIDKNGLWYTGEKLCDIDNFPNNLGKMSRVSFIPGCKELYIDRHGKYVSHCVVDMAFVCLHGLFGEDGCVAGILNMSNIPYSSCDLMSSSVSMDKGIFKVLCRGLSVSVVDGFAVSKKDFINKKEQIIQEVCSFGFPIIIKPARQGSSVGIEVCKSVQSLSSSLLRSFLYDDSVLVEKYIDVDKEINIAVFEYKNDVVFSDAEEPKYLGEILSFDDKYLKNPDGFQGISRVCPAKIDEDLLNEIKVLSEKVYQELKMFGVVRFDFILSKEGLLYLNEVNTIPGSMANYLFSGTKFSTLLDMIRKESVLRCERGEVLASSYDSSFLKSGQKFIKK